MMKYLCCLVLFTIHFNINALAMEDELFQKTGTTLVKSLSSNSLNGSDWGFIDDEEAKKDPIDYGAIPYSQIEDMEPIDCITFECCCKSVVIFFAYQANLLWNVIPPTYDWVDLYKRFLCKRIDYKNEDDDS